MVDGLNGGIADPQATASVLVTGFENGAVRVALSQGLTADAAERLLYGAMKGLDRQLLVAALQATLTGPRIVGARELPRPLA
jgi:hypothetical protein